VTDAERAALLDAAVHDDDDNVLLGLGVDPLAADPVLAGAARLIDHYGAWYDPVLSPEGAIEVARLVLGTLQEATEKENP